MILMQALHRDEAPAQRKADSPCRKEQGGRDGFHRGDQLRHHDGIFDAIHMLPGVESKAETTASNIFDFAESGHEYVVGSERFDQSNTICRNHRKNPPRDGHFDDFRDDMAMAFAALRTPARCHGYPMVTGTESERRMTPFARIFLAIEAAELWRVA